ncbi:MAG: hypothetical protein FWG56_03295 [Desulfovibrionaceae bacterium]|nr:hypothetical protein [Desulfovibrionaceae bacterium]
MFDLRRALDIADPDLAQRHAATEAFYFASRAQALRQAGQTEPARQAAAQAVKALSGATPPQTVDEDDWLRLADAVIEAAPDLYAALAQPITNLTAQWPLPRRREIEIRLARLQARSRHAQGDLTGALALRDRTNYILSPEGNAADDFIEYDLPWLLEAGRDDDSGRRAFFHIYEAARYMRRDVPSIVHERLADEASRSVWWPLCVIRACHAVDTLERFLGPDPAALPARSPVHARLFAALAKQTDIAAALPAIFAAARQLADERSPGHLWIKRVTAVHDQEQGRIDAATLLEILEATAAAGHMRDRRTWYGIVEERIKVKGLEQALQYPPPVLESGLACYFFVVFLEDFVDAELEKLSETQRSRLHDAWKNISRAVYEDGLTRMARFFETGQGHPGDASLHLYSMMCNNLSIIYRDECKRYEDAIALHRNGIEVSSFAEHYSGIFWSLKYILDDAQDLKPEAKKALMAKIVSAGEDLWQYALAHGYSRHNPNNYTTWVGYYLYRLDRDGEIPLWLERLVQWQEGEDGENPAHLSDVALQRRMGFFSYMHHANRDAAETLWAAMKPQVVASKDEYTHYVISRDLQIYFNRPAEAIAFFEKHLELNPRKTEEQREQAQEIEQRLAECRSLAAPAPRARWRFWK